jgi:hypothetical protein
MDIIYSVIEFSYTQPWIGLVLLIGFLIFVKMVLNFILRLVRGYEPKSSSYCENCTCERCKSIKERVSLDKKL